MARSISRSQLRVNARGQRLRRQAAPFAGPTGISLSDNRIGRDQPVGTSWAADRDRRELVQFYIHRCLTACRLPAGQSRQRPVRHLRHQLRTNAVIEWAAFGHTLNVRTTDRPAAGRSRSWRSPPRQAPYGSRRCRGEDGRTNGQLDSNDRAVITWAVNGATSTGTSRCSRRVAVTPIFGPYDGRDGTHCFAAVVGPLRGGLHTYIIWSTDGSGNPILARRLQRGCPRD